MDMRIEDKVKNDYFDWMYDMMCEGRFAKTITYRQLFRFLHDVEFTYFVPHDENRAKDGISLRYKYCVLNNCKDLEYCLDGPCSILEMMVALASRCEETMDDPGMGDRTGQWFWGMIVSLGLGGQLDNRYDARVVDDILDRFLDREYEPDGSGGLFTIEDCHRDLRDVEIWNQMWWYIDTLS